MRHWLQLILLKQHLAVFALFMGISWSAAATELTGVTINDDAGGNSEVSVVLTFSDTPPAVRSYSVASPPRVVFDLLSATNAVNQREIPSKVGNIEAISIANGADRTRLVINLQQSAGFRTEAFGNQLVIRIGDLVAFNRSSSSSTATAVATKPASAAQPTRSSAPSKPASIAPVRPSPVPVDNRSAGNQNAAPNSQPSPRFSAPQRRLTSVDFRRSDNQAGKILLDLSLPGASVDIKRQGRFIVARLADTAVNSALTQRFDVKDFATVVDFIDVKEAGDAIELTIEPNLDDISFLASEDNGQLTIDITPQTAEIRSDLQVVESPFTGEPLSLNFQNIEIRAVLQLIADFTGLNLVASDSVNGEITLRLQDVPWDQALDLVLKSKGLDQRRIGNVLLVAPAAEIVAREQIELEARQSAEKLSPMVTEYLQIRYAKADAVVELLTSAQGLVSERGSAVVDTRTNTILVKETPASLEKIKEAVEVLDVPVQQVLIEARIVVANTNVGEEMGIQWGGGFYRDNGNNSVTAGGSRQTLDEGSQILLDRASGTTPSQINRTAANIINLGLTGTPAASIAFGYQTSDYLLDLELAAIETDGRAEVISQPRVITADGQQASIESGTEIPFEQSSPNGGTSIAFRPAVLRLDVTPQITPDDRIIMDLEVNQDSVGEQTTAGPSINTNAVKTQVLVNNGETIVLGGIYRSEEVRNVRKTPILGDLPLIGALFRRTFMSDAKSELLVFITPRLVKESMNTP